METAVLNLQSLYERMRTQVDLLSENIEPSEYIMATGSVVFTFY